MSPPLRVVIVDDEPLAREGLRLRLATQPDLVVVEECATGTEALTAMATLDADVVFLDINMPDLDGFTVLARSERGTLPAIIFVTAYGEHALRAFRARALDYLVKPYDEDQLADSVQRARDYVIRVRESAAARHLHRLMSDTGEAPAQSSAPPLTRLAIKTMRRITFVEAHDIAWLEAAGDYVRVHATTGVYLASYSLRVLESRLDPGRFVRIHRTAIVAIPSIRELQPYSRGAYVVVLRDGTQLTLSRRHRAHVATALGTPL
jgi:two-component system LytT family response regulator